MREANSDSRYHSLDALRAFALLLGIVFHAAESFCPGRYSWAVVDVNAHWVFDLFQHVCHSFRMEIFFLIAGFFARMLLLKIGERQFIIHRARRILLPLVAGWFLLYPCFMLVWLWGKSTTGRLSDLGVPPQFWSLAPPQLMIGMFQQGTVFREAFNLLHLWFLYYLVLLYCVALGLRRLLLQADPAGIFMKRADVWFAPAFASIWSLPIFAAAVLPLVRLMGGGVETPNTSLVPHIPVLVVYGIFFGTGWLLHRQPALLEVPARRWKWLLTIAGGLVALEAVTRMYRQPWSDLLRTWPWVREMDRALYVVMMWAFVLGITGCFFAACKAPNKWWRYAADSSYWLYLVHHLVVVPLQIWVAPFPWSAAVKYLIINVATFPILFASYHWLVRATFVGAFLNGRRYPRRLLSNDADEKRQILESPLPGAGQAVV